MEIYLLRHGVSTANEMQLVCGAADYPLSQKGSVQARHVCDKLKSIKFTKIYSSPLIRALETIKNLDCLDNLITEPELVELNTGDASHITVTELWESESRYRYQGVYPYLKYPAGECLDDMLSRMRNWYVRCSQDWSENDIILISGHEGTVCGILHHLLNLDVVNYPTFEIGNCDYVRISFNTAGQIRYRFFSLI